MKHEPKEKPETKPSHTEPEVPLLPGSDPVQLPPEISPAPETVPSPEPDPE